jgi:TRAP-type mannitol/chloroaromatic compound transport system permease small subunit
VFKKVIQKVDHAISRISMTLMLVSGMLVFIMAWVETYGVLKRYAFHAPDPFAYEVSTMALLLCGVLAFAGVELLDRHVRNDLVASRFPSKMKVILISTLFPLLALVFCAILDWKSLGDAIYTLQIGKVSQSTWKIPLAPIKFMIPLGYTLLCIVLAGKFIRGIGLLISAKSPEQTEREPEDITTI